MHTRFNGKIIASSHKYRFKIPRFIKNITEFLVYVSASYLFYFMIMWIIFVHFVWKLIFLLID